MKKSTLKAISAVAVLGALGLSLGAVSSWYTNWNTSTWFGRGSTVTENNSPNPDEGENNLVITPNDSDSVMSLKVARLMSSGDVNAQSLDSYVITATIEPADVTYPIVTWSAAWTDSSSTWATDKNVYDYVSVEEDGLECTVSAIEAFGEQITITCAYFDDLDINATCTVDYIQRLQLPHGGGHMDIKRYFPTGNTSTQISINEEMHIRASGATYSVGTVRGEISWVSIVFSIPESLQTTIINTSGLQSDFYGSKLSFRTTFFTFANGYNTTVKISDMMSFINAVGNPTSYRGKINSAFVNAFRNGETITATANFTYEYDGAVISTGQAVGSFTVNADSIVIPASDISLDNTELLF